MSNENKEYDAHYAHGWVEVLYRDDGLPAPVTIDDLSSDQYTQVGSNLPLCEYYSPVDVYRQFAEAGDTLHGVPRSIRAYDAVNLCSDEFDKIVTLILIPKVRLRDLAKPGSSVQGLKHMPLFMLTRPRIFESFYLSNLER